MRLEVEPALALDGFSVEVGETLWIPLMLAAAGAAEVLLAIVCSGDELVALSPERHLRMPHVGRPVRLCVELFAVATTRRPVYVSISATAAGALYRMVALPVEVRDATER